MHWFSFHTHRIAHLLLLSLALSVTASCDMVVSIGVLGDLLGMTAAHADHDPGDLCMTQHVSTPPGSPTDDACSTEQSCAAESTEAGGCCTPGGDDCALPCWYCGCAHSFSTAVTGAAPSPIPLLLQGSVPETVAATLATDRPRLIHPPSIA